MFIVNQGKLLIVFAKELKQTNALFMLNFKCVLFEDSEKAVLGCFMACINTICSTSNGNKRV